VALANLRYINASNNNNNNNNKCYDQIENVVFVMGREVDTLSEVDRRQKRQKLRGKMVSRIIKMDVKVASYNEFVTCGSSDRKERIEIFKKH